MLEHCCFRNYIGNYFCSDCPNRSGLAELSADWQLLDFYASSFAHLKTLHLIYDQDSLCKFYHQSYKNSEAADCAAVQIPFALDSIDLAFDLSIYPVSAGMSNAARIAIITRTTISSTSVKPFLAFSFDIIELPSFTGIGV